MRILLTSKAGAGHVGPLIPFARALRAAGAHVLLAAPREAAPLVTRAGLPFHPLPDPPSERRDPIFASLGELDSEEQGVRVMRDVFAGIDTASALPGTLRVMADYRPDAVLRDPTEYAGLLAAERLGIPQGRIGIMAADTETWGIPVVAPVLDGHRERLGLRPDPKGLRITGSPYLTVFPEALESAQDAGGPYVVRFREHEPVTPMPDDDDDGDDRPLVYVTYGSVAPAMPVFPHLFRATVDALTDVPARVLFTIAGADRDALGPVPDHVRVESWIPQAAVMPHAAAVLCHGGSGTTRMALAAGVPVVIVPGFADQPRNASRVDELGAGIALPGWPEGLAGIGDAVRRVLEDPSYRRVAAGVADEVAALPPVSGAIEVLRRWIAPARAA
jgi:UDP:flavonoid glycosyltransferase YjiC (YdhE family)